MSRERWSSWSTKSDQVGQGKASGRKNCLEIMSSPSKRKPTGSASSQKAAGNVSGLAGLRVRGSAGSGHRGKSCERPKPFRIGSLNVGTVKGKLHELVETMSRRRVDLCCLQETRRRATGVIPVELSENTLDPSVSGQATAQVQEE